MTPTPYPNFALLMCDIKVCLIGVLIGLYWLVGIFSALGLVNTAKSNTSSPISSGLYRITGNTKPKTQVPRRVRKISGMLRSDLNHILPTSLGDPANIEACTCLPREVGLVEWSMEMGVTKEIHLWVFLCALSDDLYPKDSSQMSHLYDVLNNVGSCLSMWILKLLDVVSPFITNIAWVWLHTHMAASVDSKLWIS